MRKAGTDESNVQMSDVICDFCHREWTDDVAMVEGHQGSCICGNCLTLAYTAVVMHNSDDLTGDYSCVLCLEGDDDRAALGREGEPGWRSPIHEDAAVCRRCIKQAAGALHKSRDYPWAKPDRE